MISRNLVTIQRIVRSIENAPDLASALDRLVNAIHKAMDVDVCSVYLTDTANNTNVLMATRGLNPDSIGKVIIPFDEGLVGLVTQSSEPVLIDNARSHPRFKFIPESGEEPYNSFLGVPVTHHGEQLAVLVVQQDARRRFNEQDIAFLSTLAALIAGNIASARARGQLQEYFAMETAAGGKFAGVAGAHGIRIGTGVVVFRNSNIMQVPDRPAADPQAEEAMFRDAIAAVIAEAREVSTQLGNSLPATDRALFDAYALIAGSEHLVDETVAVIHAGNWAPGALRTTIQSLAEKFESLDDPYMRERGNDIRNIGQHILDYLVRSGQKDIDYPERTVLVGENLSPLDIAKVPFDRLAAIVTGHGSAYSHIAILAHALGIPAVLGFSGQVPLNRLDGKTIIVDGYQGQIVVSPAAGELHDYQELISGESRLDQTLAALHDLPAVTADGVRIHLYTNTGLLAGHTHAFDVGTEGIGLYRSEFPFMYRESFPGEEEQRVLYREVIQAYAPRPVTLRTLDAGGDKVLPYLNINEPNPFLGWRGIRIVLDHPEIMLTQVRAMLRASLGYDNLRILLPMISNLSELDRAIGLIRQAFEHIRRDDSEVQFPAIGAMIEIPSAVFQIESILERVDFVSVGTNDLVQYLLAIDRNNERVAKMFDPLHPAVLTALDRVASTARARGKPVTICGEAASDPALVILLIAMRVHSLSLSASDLPRVKWVIRTYTHEYAARLWEQARGLEYVVKIRDLLCSDLESNGLGGLIRPGA